MKILSTHRTVRRNLPILLNNDARSKGTEGEGGRGCDGKMKGERTSRTDRESAAAIILNREQRDLLSIAAPGRVEEVEETPGHLYRQLQIKSARN